MTRYSPTASDRSSREVSPLTPVPSREGTPEEVSAPTTASPLHKCLLGCVTSPGAFTQDVVEQHIPMENNPRPLSARMGDNAEYWVDQSGDVLHLKFPAKLDFGGQWCRLGPYFSLPDSGVRILLDICTVIQPMLTSVALVGCCLSEKGQGTL
jgi:hypothetical protein